MGTPKKLSGGETSSAYGIPRWDGYTYTYTYTNVNI